jgi:hypothetical protein
MAIATGWGVAGWVGTVLGIGALPGAIATAPGAAGAVGAVGAVGVAGTAGTAAVIAAASGPSASAGVAGGKGFREVPLGRVAVPCISGGAGAADGGAFAPGEVVGLGASSVGGNGLCPTRLTASGGRGLVPPGK